jgi:type IV pilus assembly protein PilV
MPVHKTSLRREFRHKSRTYINQSGVSLIEVLISIVISAIGILALVGVNAASIRYTKMSQYRGTATMLAGDLGERMRANKAGFTAGNYDFNVTDFSGQEAVATLPNQLCNASATTCTAAQIAALDIAQWRILVRSQLPEGSVFIQRDAARSGADVFVAWRDPAVAATDEAPAAVGECPNGLSLNGDESIRCVFFRVQL